MKLNEAFPGKWLKAEDFDEDTIVTIKSVEVEEVKGNNGNEKKLVLRFREFEKGLICNKVNGASISKVLKSDDTDEWLGKRITLYSTDVQYGMDMVPGIRVRSKPPAPKAGKPATVAAPPAEEDDDSDIPF